MMYDWYYRSVTVKDAIRLQLLMCTSVPARESSEGHLAGDENHAVIVIYS
jgi:hypothetical protein